MVETFRSELEKLINRFSMERTGGNTQDFLLADYLNDSLKLFGSIVSQRDALTVSAAEQDKDCAHDSAGCLRKGPEGTQCLACGARWLADTTRNPEQPMTQYMRDELEGMAEGFAEEESQDVLSKEDK